VERGVSNSSIWTIQLARARLPPRPVRGKEGGAQIRAGSAITFSLKHWNRLTLFLHQAGAPLDNNICERALKKAICHRKNSLFYKTENGAEVGDLFMSLIHTCDLNDANPFDYLTELRKHAVELAKNPAAWMPWNYRQTLQQATANEDSA
jgi:transposase